MKTEEEVESKPKKQPKPNPTQTNQMKTGQERNTNDKFALKRTKRPQLITGMNAEEYFLAGCWEGSQGFQWKMDQSPPNKAQGFQVRYSETSKAEASDQLL